MNNTESLYIAWQAPDTRDWHVVGNLQSKNNGYTFNYTNGAKKSNKFTPFSGMTDLDKKYVSTDLFPLFKNRLLSPRRPEYSKFIEWLGLSKDSASPIEVLARSGGIRSTDQLQIFKKIEADETGYIEHYFFAHGLSYLSESANKRVSTLKTDDSLRLLPDIQNDYDEHAIAIRTQSPIEIVGYCPRYFAETISTILKNDTKSVELKVHQISTDSPYSYRLLCKLQGYIQGPIKDNKEYLPIC